MDGAPGPQGTEGRLETKSRPWREAVPPTAHPSPAQPRPSLDTQDRRRGSHLLTHRPHLSPPSLAALFPRIVLEGRRDPGVVTENRATHGA